MKLVREPEQWEVRSWTDRQLLLFAADCWEHVLPKLDDSPLGREAQERAIEVLRKYAQGEMSPEVFDGVVALIAPRARVAGMWPDHSELPIDAGVCAKLTASDAIRRAGRSEGRAADHAVWAAAGYLTGDERWQASVRVQRARRILRIAGMTPEQAAARAARIASAQSSSIVHLRELRDAGNVAEADRFATRVARYEATEAEDTRLAEAYSVWLGARGRGLSTGDSPIAEYDEVLAVDRSARNAFRRAERPVKNAEREWQRRRFAEIVACNPVSSLLP